MKGGWMIAEKEGLCTREDFRDELEHGGGAQYAIGMLEQADELALLISVGLDKAAYDSNKEDMWKLTAICSRLAFEAHRSLQVAADLLADL